MKPDICKCYLRLVRERLSGGEGGAGCFVFGGGVKCVNFILF